MHNSITITVRVIELNISTRDRGRDRDRVGDRDRRSEPDRRSEAINFGANSGRRSEPNNLL